MIEIFKQLTEMGWATVVLTVILIVLFTPAAIKAWKEFWETLGFTSTKEIHETEQELKIKELDEKLEKYQNDTLTRETTWHQQSIDIRDGLQQNQEHMVNTMTDISKSLEDLKAELLNEKIERMRWRILDFATTLRNDHVADVEQFSNVLAVYDKYEQLIEEHKLVNNQVNASIAFIKTKYQELLNGDQ